MVHYFLMTGSLQGLLRGGSRIFFRRGALVSCSSSTPINHSFFLQNTSCIRKPQVISCYSSIQVRGERSHIDSLSDHNFLSKHQSGFHVLHSTVIASLEVCNNNCNVNAVSFLDLRKRDTVDHNISYCLN